MPHLIRRVFLGLTLAGLLSAAAPAPKPVVVFAAASLQESLTAAAEAFAARGYPKPVISFAASSALARQIEGGAPADIFFSADEDWMNSLEGKGLLRPRTRAPVLGNRLVLVVPKDQPLGVRIGDRFPLAQALGAGRLAMADPAAVPAGKYGKAALETLRVWDSVSARVVQAENVRAALLLVERGEARAGIVYATDALASSAVAVAATFPARSHPPIIYPLAITKDSANPDAAAFRAFLLSSAGKAIFARHGFSPL